MLAVKGKGLSTGAKMPFFDLPGADGKNHSPKEFEGKKVLAVIFTCNHCPYAKAYQKRIKLIQQILGQHGVQVIAINSNDAQGYPEDGFEQMVLRAKKEKFCFPYLRDESQEIARAFGAQVTPDCFVFDADRKLVYRGRVDDNWENEGAAKSRDLQRAIEETLSGKKVSVPEALATGCSIKWKSAE